MPEHVDFGVCRCWGCVQESVGEKALTQEIVVSPSQQLKRARTWRLRDRLLLWSPETLWVEGQGPRIGMQKPLLLELQEQVRPSGEGGAGGAGFGPGMPVAAAALALMQDIEREVSDRLWSLPRPAEVPEKLAHRIQYWVACLNDRPDLIDECYAVLGGWVQRINDLFNPPTVVRLRRKCPTCNLSHVWETLDGERVQNRALVAVIRPASDTPVLVECRGCGAGWCGPSIHELEELTRPQE
ncbi:hypothetical protein ACTXL8_05485 [Glutamicibacter arilaitensis]|uniref:hypothetical protein n=1 Tax=Glutamicibacter arilaitensis TaxID=256701 RepID=UPI003FD3B22C